MIQVRDGLTGLGQALIQGPGSLREEGNLDTDTYGGDHMKMQVEIGMMCLQTKEWRGLLEAARSLERRMVQVLRQNCRGSTALLMP